MPSLAVVILTRDEAHHIGRAIDSVAGIASEIFVIDSGSTDATMAIAEAKGAKAVFNAWVNQSVQFQWAMDNMPITADWVMRLDADEVIEPDLAANITAQLPGLAPGITGVNLKRKHIFLGRWIRHGGRYPVTLLRIWRRGKARIEQRWMDEHMLLTEGEATEFEGGFADINLGDITYFTDKHNSYATREAVDVLNKKYDLFAMDDGGGTLKIGQAKRKRAFKEKVYNKLPFGTGPLLYFLYRYFIQLGFLDGKEGAIYHGLQGLWYRYLVDAKILELDRALQKQPTPEKKLATLETLTGLKLKK